MGIFSFKSLTDLLKRKSYIEVNGKRYEGNNVSFKNNEVYIDGVNINCEAKIVNIQVTGDIGKLDLMNANTIDIKGNVQTIDNMNGDISVTGDVFGDIENMNGNIDISGSATGKIDCKNGNVKHR